MPYEPKLKMIQSGAARERSEPEITIVREMLSAQAEAAENARSFHGEQFGKYVLVGEVATGGMAEVFVGVHKGVEDVLKVVVIKRVLRHLTSSIEFTQMFIDEARLASRLEHRNIVRTYEFGEHGGEYFTVMEYLAGEELSKILNQLAAAKQMLPINVAASIVAQLCAGLHFAHELTDTTGRPLDLVHRDINPSNIVLTYSGEVKIIDFGVAKATTNLAQTVAGTVKGKLAYMSPEQVLARDVDRRSDVFSLGVVLWEAVTGTPLFARNNEGATLYAIMNQPIPPASSLRPGVPKELDLIIARALARAPDERYDTAEAMLVDLDAFLVNQPRIDARAQGKLLEQLFGTHRAEAKRAIAAGRSLAKNISLVMKLRTEIRSDLAATADAAAAGGVTTMQATPVPTSRRFATIALIACGVLGVLGGLAYSLLGTTTAQPAAAQAVVGVVELESSPPGAAIFLSSEPTGLRTPATLTDLRAGEVAVRLELPGHIAVSDSFPVTAGETVKRRFVLVPTESRLVLSGLPGDASVFVAGREYMAGEVIAVPGGRHEIRIVSKGRVIALQTVEAAAGDQVWTLVNNQLVRK